MAEPLFLAAAVIPTARPPLPLVPPPARPLAGVRYAEIETSRLCNRSCSWCPTGQTAWRKHQELMDWGLFAKITAELGAVGFDGYFAFHNYNEPLANPRLLREITWVRTEVPHAKPSVYTNGDLLKRDLLVQMRDEGVKYIRVTRYPHRATTVPTYEALRRWLKLAGLDGPDFDWRFSEVRQGLAATWTDAGTGTRVEVIRPAIDTYNDRGGTAVVPKDGELRRSPCLMTATSISVNYLGEVKMCCNVEPLEEQHRQYVVGNVRDASLGELFGGPLMAVWRERQAQADWSASAACRTCVQPLPETRR
ncbi:radical SAM/SPASM domain-containing protein [Kitasatospora kifunensis]|uniref:MoaA/NifB/PqqE/SkfB family radical SAM enzyme n=1 Tax=Kitasatospora kifunensis TaxID=58351 RepID=A0A7W7R5Z4_KITKI|nr:radical SAM/SPASM domain-containing protein [Kitasatospora kifunensis]MBB4926047.1 MoaA/NifB/PqqE/SkfB family radical SAM enzyme [Kitasatospora kifunensis]